MKVNYFRVITTSSSNKTKQNEDVFGEIKYNKNKMFVYVVISWKFVITVNCNYTAVRNYVYMTSKLRGKFTLKEY